MKKEEKSIVLSKIFFISLIIIDLLYICIFEPIYGKKMFTENNLITLKL